VGDARFTPDETKAAFEAHRFRAERRQRRLLRVGVEALVFAVLVAVTWVERSTVSQSIRVGMRAEWRWLLIAGVCELVSMMAFARTQRIVLLAAGVHASIPSMAATALAGNAISVTLPLVGPGAGSVFSYGRFRRVADDPAPAGWALLISGLISNLVWVVLIAIGAVVSGNPAATFSGLVGGVAVLVAAIVAILALHRSRSRKVVVRLAARLVGFSQRFRGRPLGEPDDVAEKALEILSAYRMRPREWVQTVRLSFVNWLAGVGCLMASILAVGAGVPWTKVILIYCAGAAAGSFNLTPGGLGVTEDVLTAGLVASGLKPPAALGSALVFRLVSFWLVTLVGWIIYSELRSKARRGPPAS
jgi:uncharacterized protein (TIRG00374 family)